MANPKKGTKKGHGSKGGGNHIEIDWRVKLLVYFGYAMMTVVGYVRDWLDNLFGHGNTLQIKDGYAPLARDFEEFYRRRMYDRAIDLFSRPIAGPAGSHIEILERDRFNGNRLTGKKTEALNLSSYNYLGFAEPGGVTEKDVFDALDKYGLSTGSSPIYSGYTALHDELEREVASFIGAESAMIFGMGWGTNTTAIPALVGKGCLIVSDSINHNSIVVGARSSGARIKTFPHGDMARLERIVRNAVVQGQPRTHRPWKKILIIVEGVYSMEGEICDLAAVVAIKKKYKCYLYLDEAHSIGAVGPNGKGVCEHTGVNPRDVDVLMGTFTKSFGAIGGYVAGSRKLVERIRHVCASHIFSSGLSPPCAAQVLAAFRVIQTKKGHERMDQLALNANLMRKTLEEEGLHVLGDYQSPVVPMLTCQMAKTTAFGREMLRRGIAVVCVGFPATPLLESRVRFCLSSALTTDEIVHACQQIVEAADVLKVRFKRRITG